MLSWQSSALASPELVNTNIARLVGLLLLPSWVLSACLLACLAAAAASGAIGLCGGKNWPDRLCCLLTLSSVTQYKHWGVLLSYLNSLQHESPRYICLSVYTEYRERETLGMSPIWELVLSIQQWPRSLVRHEILWSKVINSQDCNFSPLTEYSPSIDCQNTCVEISSQAAPREAPQCNLCSRPRPRSPLAACPPRSGSPASRTTPAGPGCPREPRGAQTLGSGLLLGNISFRSLSHLLACYKYYLLKINKVISARQCLNVWCLYER